MNTFTYQELMDFISAQPDERPVRMLEPRNMRTLAPFGETCGCVLIHFARHKGDTGDFLCSFYHTGSHQCCEGDEADITNLIHKLCGLSYYKDDKLTYKDIKEFLMLKDL